MKRTSVIFGIAAATLLAAQLAPPRRSPSLAVAHFRRRRAGRPCLAM
ncbi:hypothetical protein [Armatimonas sp.]|nr:hypothetical protein [Armatimonas sp.]